MTAIEKLRAIAARLRGREAGGRDYDRETVAVMERVLQADSNCVDVGASAGAVLRHIARLAPRGTHFAFEPLPEFCRKLAKEFPRVQVHDVALSDCTEEAARFQHVVSNPAYSGLRRRTYARPDERVEEVTVRCGRLDDWVPREVAIRFVKIDVEGGEFRVLKGGIEMVRRDRPFIVFEFGLGGADWYGVGPEDMWALLTGCGLEVSVMSEWLAGKAPLGEREFAREFREYGEYYFLAHPRG